MFVFQMRRTSKGKRAHQKIARRLVQCGFQILHCHCGEWWWLWLLVLLDDSFSNMRMRLMTMMLATRRIPLLVILLLLLVLIAVNAFTTTLTTTCSIRKYRQQHHQHHQQRMQIISPSTLWNPRHFTTRSILSSSSSSSARSSSLLLMSSSSSSSVSSLSLGEDSFTGESNVTTTTANATNTTSTTFIMPTWRQILEIPITINTQQQFDSIPILKRLAIVSRVSVLHLTLLSCGGPFILRGACAACATTTATTTTTTSVPLLTPLLALLFTIDGLSWHAVHNLLNDWQDLDDDDKNVDDSFRLAYGCHALKQGFVNKRQFLQIMMMVATPGIVLTILFSRTVLAPAAIYGILALFFYTILFKPFVMGEILIYLVWGPLMAGFGQLAAGAPWTVKHPMSLFTDPIVAIFGLAAFSVIMGKHTDKITTSKKRTLPKVLGFPAATYACALTIIAPHVLLAGTFLYQRLWPIILSSSTTTSTASVVVPSPTLPLGAALGFLTLLREVPAALKTLSRGAPTSIETANGKRPPLWARGKIIPGTLVNANVNQAWPLWFVAFCGWHALTFTYLVVIGSAMEWMLRVIATRLGLFF